MKKIVLFILILGIFVGSFFYFYQKNIYSKQILKLEILGEEEVQAFKETEFLVKYKNNGNVVLEEPELIFQFPKNSLDNNNQLQKRIIQKLDDIYPGEEKTISFKTRLFGKENDTLQTEAFLKYRPRNLKAFYESKTTFTTKIRFVPLTFEFDLPSKIEFGKEVQFHLNYFSNSDWPLSNLQIKIEYPSGFEFLDSKPKAIEKTEWQIPILNKTEGKRIEIKGKLSGEQKEEKIFRAFLGMWQEGEFIVLKEINKGVMSVTPTIFVFQQINGNSEYITNLGDILHYEVFFRNTGEESFQNLFLIADLEGEIFDFDSIKVLNGQVQKNNNSIIWDWRDIPKLKFLDQGEEGKVEFWVNLKKIYPSDFSIINKNLTLKDKITLPYIKQQFEIKVNSKLEVTQTGYREIGDTEKNFYTITWEAKNYYNDVNNIKVKAVLPQNVNLTGKILPEGSKFTFDTESREIVWDVGRLEAGSNSIITFQIAISEIISNNNQLLLVNEAKIIGDDEWTGQILEATSSAINIL